MESHAPAPSFFAPNIFLGTSAIHALAEKTLIIDGGRGLIVSDLHFEKGSSYAQRGQLLPPYDSAQTLAKLSALIEGFAPQYVVSLGDSFHDLSAGARMDENVRQALIALTEQTDFIWVEGNHDPAPPTWLKGQVCAEISIDGLCLTHQLPAIADPKMDYIFGHFHPVAKVATPLGKLRQPCFIHDGSRLIMPSFGAFTGGLNILDPAFNGVLGSERQILACGQKGLFPIHPERLLADR